MPLLGFRVRLAHRNADAIVASSQQFTYFQGGGFDVTLLSFMQVERATAASTCPSSDRNPISRQGAAASSTITAHARRIVFSGFFPPPARSSRWATES